MPESAATCNAARNPPNGGGLKHSGRTYLKTWDSNHSLNPTPSPMVSNPKVDGSGAALIQATPQSSSSIWVAKTAVMLMITRHDKLNPWPTAGRRLTTLRAGRTI